MTSISMTLPSAYYQPFNQSPSYTLILQGPPIWEPGMLKGKDETLLAEARQQTYDLQFLAPGWNGYDAVPPTASAVDQAMRWLVSSYAECKDAHVHWYKPNVIASAEGEVVFEWWAENRFLSAYIDTESASFHKSFWDGNVTHHEHGEVEMGAKQADLLYWFGE